MSFLLNAIFIIPDPGYNIFSPVVGHDCLPPSLSVSLLFLIGMGLESWTYH